jgi:hypothetical protein
MLGGFHASGGCVPPDRDFRRRCSMMRTTLYTWVAASLLTIAACSGTPQTPVSPSGTTPSDGALNPDGSSLKVTAPSGLSPSGGTTTSSRRPTLSFTGSTGRFQAVSISGYDLEVFNPNNSVVYSRSNISTSHTLEADLTYSDNHTWRVRARIGDQFGPWSAAASFRTPDSPTPVPPPSGGGGTLPFPIPAACGPGDPSNRIPCVLAMAALSTEWAGCASGRGISCHRFTRQVVFALAQSDPNWRMIQAAPGGNACNCTGCGPSDGTMFREDTTVYGGNRVFDMIAGAGGPTPSITWSAVVGPRPGDIPASAPLCP